MNKNAIKKFAIDARNKLIASVTDKAGMLGITPDNCSEAITKGIDFEVYKTTAGTEVTLNKKQCEQRRKLVDQINAKGFEAVVEEVAYTWFNRICAIRFMEVNDYMYPVRVRVLSSEKKSTVSGLVKNEPDVVTMAPDIDWDFTDKEREEIIDAKMNGSQDELFRKLFLKQCNLLHEVLPGLFEGNEDYMEPLLTLSYTDKDGIIYHLIHDIEEDDFNVEKEGQVEIIGWLYQYYISEKHDEIINIYKGTIKKDDIPAATQLFNVKSAILGKIFNAYVNGKMGWDKFCELSEVNERMFVSDYKMLLSDEKMQYTNGNYIISRLIALGIVVEKDAPNASKTYIEMFYNVKKSDIDLFNKSDYQITSFGEELIKYLNVKIPYGGEKDEFSY